ncbi:unnamed protein product [Acanthoscelides obtectus]|uniref:HTH CENPB-type domain-containing protein n=1 Tax=Acanthoscelides obtectus TaxID=200917 RepID=A0A9P0VRH0_ACAOB|nr:unnamed protein product [Acanthoscelides obtectus]CAK1687926.1 hypothetical protein AOBTE_LOCUS36457 [Acanthoscelides obtectus]
MDNRFFGLRRSDVKRMAFELAIANNIQHPFSQEKGVAGKKWLRGFFKRNPQLSVRSPQGMSNARIRGFNQESVASFFDLYEKELSKINFAPQRLFNVDETGISVVQHKRSKVISAKVAYNRAATMEVSVNSFRTTGLFPLNRNIFRDHDFSVFEVEEKLTVPEDTGGTSKDSSDIEDAADDPRPGNSKESNDQGAVNSSRKAVKYLSEPTKLVSPVQIKPLPKIKSKKPSARAGSAALITSSPYKDDLTESLDKKRKRKIPQNIAKLHQLQRRLSLTMQGKQSFANQKVLNGLKEEGRFK